jgi:hypothetical protein
MHHWKKLKCEHRFSEKLSINKTKQCDVAVTLRIYIPEMLDSDRDPETCCPDGDISWYHAVPTSKWLDSVSVRPQTLPI